MNIEYVKQLIDKGTGVNKKDEMGFTPLMIAVINGYDTLTALLLEKGADVHAETTKDEYEPELDQGGDTALLLAVSSCRDEIKHPRYIQTIRLLLEAGSDVNAKNNGGETAIRWSFQYRNKQISTLLVQYGADVESHSFFRFVDYYWDMVALSRWVRKRPLLCFPEN